MSDDEYDYEEEEEALPRSRVHQEAWAILIVAISLFCLLSLISYVPVESASGPAASESPQLDQVYRGTEVGESRMSQPDRAQPSNLCGAAGNKIASALLHGIGTAAYLLVGLITFWGLSALIQRRLHAPVARLIGGALLVIAVSTLATLARLDHYGGWVGAYFHARLEEQFSLPGSYLLLLSSSLIGILLSTDWLPLTATWKLIDHLRQDDEEEEDDEDEEEWEEEDEEEEWDEEDDEEELAEGGWFSRRVRSIRNAIGNRLLVEEEEDEEDEAEEEEAPPPRKKRARKAAAAVAGVENDDAGPARRTPRKKKAADSNTAAETGAAGKRARKTEPAVADDAEPAKKPAARKAVATKKAAQEEDSGEKKRLGMIGGGVAPVPKLKVNASKLGKVPAKLLGKRTDSRGFDLPPIDLLSEPVYQDQQGLDEFIRETSALLIKTLASFKVEGQVVEIDKGPVITQYEVELAAGIKVQKVVNLTDDLAMALKNPVRIVAPIPGKSTVGIEVPNAVREPVCLRELAVSKEYLKSKAAIPFIMGKDASGLPVIEDLAAMPHLLIAGSTGSGKSICINTVILSILLSRSPEDVQMILIDPKMVELSLFKKIPHLITPVVTDMKRAPGILDWAVNKMEERYALLADVGVKNITGFNDLGEDYIKEKAKEMDADPETVPSHLPYIVIIVDELADLMMIASKEIEGSLTRLAQKSRAVGIHIIFATQRPSVDVVTGLIKANFPARISFRVSSRVDSRTILDSIGAERLLGAGDLLYLPPRSADLLRCQGAYASEKEIKNIVSFLKTVSEPAFNPELENIEQGAGPGGKGGDKSKKRDALYEEAVLFVIDQNRGSVSLLQRQFEIGYSRAARIIDQMAEDGIVGKYKGSKAREVILTLDEWESREQN